MPELTISLDQLRVDLAHIPSRAHGEATVLSPGSTEEVSQLLRYCNERALPVQIVGAGTKRHWGGVPQAAVVIDTARLSGVREHPWQDLTATVGAGTPWAEMQRVLARHGQFVALDPLWPESATAGGVLAANDSGALRIRYGSARDLVIGMTLVLADGTIARTGGKVVKNVAGYDLHKLMIGAFGTLAVISEVTFRLHPLPVARAAYVVQSSRSDAIGAVVAAIRISHINPEAMQLRTTPGGFALDVVLAGSPEVLAGKAEELAKLAEAHGITSFAPQADSSTMQARERLFVSEGETIVKATMLPSAVPAALDEIARAGTAGVAFPFGIAYAAFAGLAQIPSSLRELVTEANGSLTILGEPESPTALMREVKRQFDPNHILNRGVMGGI